jgi:hypothetical protein
MATKTLQIIREAIISKYERDFPGETINGKVFSSYILDRYAKLLYRIHLKSIQDK